MSIPLHNNGGFSGYSDYSQNRYDGFSQNTSNVEYVTSLEEALMKCNLRPSDKVFFHQDLPVFYRIKVDAYGKKTWAQFKYGVSEDASEIPATKADLQSLTERITALESKLTQEVFLNEKSNG